VSTVDILTVESQPHWLAHVCAVSAGMRAPRLGGVIRIHLKYFLGAASAGDLQQGAGSHAVTAVRLCHGRSQCNIRQECMPLRVKSQSASAGSLVQAASLALPLSTL